MTPGVGVGDGTAVGRGVGDGVIASAGDAAWLLETVAIGDDDGDDAATEQADRTTVPRSTAITGRKSHPFLPCDARPTVPVSSRAPDTPTEY